MKTWREHGYRIHISLIVEGLAGTPSILLINTAEKIPQKVTLSQRPLSYDYSAADQLLRIHFTNESKAQQVKVTF